MEFDVTSIAAALYDGGWRAGDYDWLVQRVPSDPGASKSNL